MWGLRRSSLGFVLLERGASGLITCVSGVSRVFVRYSLLEAGCHRDIRLLAFGGDRDARRGPDTGASPGRAPRLTTSRLWAIEPSVELSVRTVSRPRPQSTRSSSARPLSRAWIWSLLLPPTSKSEAPLPITPSRRRRHLSHTHAVGCGSGPVGRFRRGGDPPGPPSLLIPTSGARSGVWTPPISYPSPPATDGGLDPRK